MFLTDLQIAARNLVQQRKRTAFLGTALAAITLLMVLMNGLIDGAQDVLLTSGSTLMTGHVNVGGFYKPSAGASAPMILDYQKVIDVVEPEVPELKYHVERVRGYAKGVSETSSMDMVIGGIDITREPGFKDVVKAIDGSLDELAKPNTILLFETQQKRLGVRAGDVITLSAPTPRGSNNTLDVRVAAIAADIGVLSSFNAYVPAESLHRLYQTRTTSTGAIQLYLKDPKQSATVAARLRTVLAAKGWRMMDPDPQPYYMKLLMKVNREDWTGQKLDVTTWEDELSFMNWSLMGMRFISVLILFVLSIIVFAGIMSTMWITIRERTREIGTLRAIGMQRGKVRRLFMLEAAMLGLASTAVGSVLGICASALINLAHIGLPAAVRMFLLTDHLSLTVKGGSIAGAVISLTLLTVAAALYPSIRAARLKPVTAMHHVG